MSTEQTTAAAPTTEQMPPTEQHQLPAAVQSALAEQFHFSVRQAKAYMGSTLVPEHYRDNLPNCMIAVNMANRIGMDVLMVMQNLYIVHGNPGWSGKFLIAAFNQCGRFTSMKFEVRGDVLDKSKADAGMRAYATEKSTGEKIIGPWVTWAMVKGEKWDAKTGSKWLTMPELMFMYRAAAFLTRTHAPEIAMGLQSVEELHDVHNVVDVTPVGDERTRVAPVERARDAVKAALEGSATTVPSVTIAELLPKVRSAATIAALDEAASLSDALSDAEEREAVRKAYQERREQLAAA